MQFVLDDFLVVVDVPCQLLALVCFLCLLHLGNQLGLLHLLPFRVDILQPF